MTRRGLLAVARSRRGWTARAGRDLDGTASTAGRCSAPRAARGGSSGKGCGRHCCAIPRTARRSALPRGASARMPLEIEVVDDPGRACSAMLVGVAAGGRPHRAHRRIDAPAAPIASSWRRFARWGWTVSGSTMWFGDERCVPPDDERSNYRLVQGVAVRSARGGSRFRRSTGCKGELGPGRWGRGLRGSAARRRFAAVRPAAARDRARRHIAPRCSRIRPRCPSARGWWWASSRPGWSRSCRGSADPARRSPPRSQIVFLATGASKADAVAAAFGDGAKPDPHVPPRCWCRLARRDHRAARRGGRRSTRVRGGAGMSSVIGVDLGGTKVAVAPLRGRDFGESLVDPDRPVRQRGADRPACGDGRPDPERRSCARSASACRRSSSSKPAGSSRRSTSR